MARETFESWIPVEMGSDPIQALEQTSVTERLGRPEPMNSDTKQVPRAGGFTVGPVAKGAAYSESTADNDYVELIARKAGGIVRIAEEDLTDTVTGERTIAVKQVEASRSLAVFYDNATLAATGAVNGTTRLYTSVYQTVRTTDSAVSYTADDNYIAGAVTYDNLSALLGKLEDSVWFDESQLFIAASPAFKVAFRGIKDTQNRPIFFEAPAGSAGNSSLFGYPIAWTLGARLAGTNTQAPTGNPILVIGNRDLLINGKARLSNEIVSPNPGFALQRARTGVGFTTDEALMKAAMRRGFAVGHPKAFAVLEKTS